MQVKFFLHIFLFIISVALSGVKMELRWLGHAAWLVKFSTTTIVIDPFLTGNPKAAISASDLKDVNYVLVTHDHSDHLGDAFSIVKNTGAKLVSMFEISQEAKKSGVPEENAIGMNIGNQVAFEGVKIGMTPAVHSSNSAGFVVSGDDHTLYHAGDTGFFGDMKHIHDLYDPDVAMLPIGGFFTMGPKEATLAAETLKAKLTFPMHYNTFPLIMQDPNEFAKNVHGSKVIVLNPGDTYKL